jgi:hypothetical protein
MATTTNYSWVTPEDTDLVKDGAAAIRTLGSSADTTVKNLNPGTTAGDIDYYTSGTAKARIAIGTAGQVLQVNAGATAPEWAAPAVTTQSFTKIATSSFSAVATTGTTFDGVFTSTYAKYLVILSGFVSSVDAAVGQMQSRASASTGTTAYYGAATSINSAGTTRNDLSSNASQWNLGRLSDTLPTVITFTFTNVGNGNQKPDVSGFGVNQYENGPLSFGGLRNSSFVMDGFILSASSGNISGTATIFGIVD